MTCVYFKIVLRYAFLTLSRQLDHFNNSIDGSWVFLIMLTKIDI